MKLIYTFLLAFSFFGCSSSETETKPPDYVEMAGKIMIKSVK